MAVVSEDSEVQQRVNEEAPDDGPPRVLVTGASGFVASHVVHLLLQQGRLRVRGTVRDKTNESKVKPLKELVPDAKYPLELVDTDLLKEETWKEAVRGCRYVMHIASPFPSTVPKTADEVIRPAVEGTLNVLKACAEVGTVKRIVLTSSIAAVSGGLGGRAAQPGKVFTEKDWSVEELCDSHYEVSKTRAEKAAWDFINKLDEEKKMELVAINPSFISGPLLIPSSGETSTTVFKRLLDNSLPAVPNVSFAIVDVRDVALAHIAALEKPEAAGNRYIICNKTMWWAEIAAIVSQHFKPQGYSVPLRVLPSFLLSFISLFNSSAKLVAKNQGKQTFFSNEKMKSELGIEPRPEEETIVDACYRIIDLGLVPKKIGYLGHPANRPQADNVKQNIKPEESTGDSKPKESTGESKPDESTRESKPEESTGESKTEELTGEPKADESTGESKPDESIGESKPEELTGESKADESTGESKTEESTEDSKPEESTEDSKPEKSTEDSKPEESTEDSKPEESTEDSKPEESTEDSKPEESTEDSKPEESA